MSDFWQIDMLRLSFVSFQCTVLISKAYHVCAEDDAAILSLQISLATRDHRPVGLYSLQ